MRKPDLGIGHTYFSGGSEEVSSQATMVRMRSKTLQKIRRRRLSERQVRESVRRQPYGPWGARK